MEKQSWITQIILKKSNPIHHTHFKLFAKTPSARKIIRKDRAEQRLRMCRDGRGLESNLVSFSKGFSKRPHILAIIKVAP